MLLRIVRKHETHLVPPSSSGIQPSNKTTYSLTQLQTALKAQTGAIPYLGCGQNGTVLQEVWYFHHVLGSVSFACLLISVPPADIPRRSNSGTTRRWIRPRPPAARRLLGSTTTSVRLPLSVRSGCCLESIRNSCVDAFDSVDAYSQRPVHISEADGLGA